MGPAKPRGDAAAIALAWRGAWQPQPLGPSSGATPLARSAALAAGRSGAGRGEIDVIRRSFCSLGTIERLLSR